MKKSTPLQFLQARATQQLEAIKQEEERKRVRDAWAYEEKQRFDELFKALQPYDDTRLDGLLCTISVNPDSKVVGINFDGKLVYSLKVYRTHRWCNSCEGPCDHKDSTSVGIKNTSHLQGGYRVNCFCFSDLSEQGIADSMTKLVDDFNDLKRKK